MKIKLHGEIIDNVTKEIQVRWYGMGEDSVSFKDIDEALATKTEEDRLVELDINCPGGSCIEGFAIYDKLRSLEGHTVTAEVIGECSSMATIVLMAASKRVAHPNSRYCIHKPRYMDFYTPVMTEQEARKAYDDLHAETDRLKKIYLDRTSFTEEELEAIMSEDRYMTAEEALRYGVVTEIATPMTATTFKRNKMKLTITQKMGLRAFGLGDMIEVMEAMEDKQMVSMTLNKEDGTTVEVEREEGDPQVGDTASPDGEHLMTDGTTIVIAEGVITEIRPAEEQVEQVEQETMTEAEMVQAITAMTETIDQLTAENEDLKSQLESSKSNEKTAEDAHILELVSNAGGISWLEAQQSSFKPAGRKPTVSNSSVISETAAEILKKYNSKN